MYRFECRLLFQLSNGPNVIAVHSHIYILLSFGTMNIVFPKLFSIMFSFCMTIVDSWKQIIFL